MVLIPQYTVRKNNLRIWPRSYPENPARTTKVMTVPIHVQVTGVRNVLTNNIPNAANPTLAHQAYNHGRSGLFPTDQRAASQPATIWMGKSINAATAKSSFGRPFSTSLSEVAASCACQAIFATKWRAKSFWISACGIRSRKGTTETCTHALVCTFSTCFGIRPAVSDQGRRSQRDPRRHFQQTHGWL